MFCSGCGQELPAGQPFCAHCGRPAAAPIPPVPGLQFQLVNYAGKVRTLSILWFIYAGLSLLLGIAGLTFAHAFLSNAPWMHGPLANGPWAHSPFPPNFLVFALHLAWELLVVRAVLGLVAGWGLMEHTSWGRIVAIVAAILSLLKFPFGTALGIWTLVMLLGFRNSTLYEQL
jgi:hypothetical protein